MTKRKPQPLEDLGARVREAQRRQAGEARAPGVIQGIAGGGLGLALRVGVELVSALIVGVGIGFLLDRWLGTKPWLLIVFFVLGSAAGVLNVFRVVSGQGGAVGYRKPESGGQTGGQADSKTDTTVDEE